MHKRRVYINGKPSKYIIYDDGRVWSEKRYKFLKPFPNPDGYLLVDLHHDGKSYYRLVHRLVAVAFIPNPNNLPVVNHKNGVKTNCCCENLEWCTYKENTQHAWRIGLIKPRYGEDNPANRYNEQTIHKVCQLLEEGSLDYKTISEITKVNPTTIYDIRKRGKWKHISSLYDIPSPVSEWDAIRTRVKELALMGMDKIEILDELNLPHTQKNKNYVSGWISYYYKHSLNDYPGDGSTPTS